MTYTAKKGFVMTCQKPGLAEPRSSQRPAASPATRRSDSRASRALPQGFMQLETKGREQVHARALSLHTTVDMLERWTMYICICVQVMCTTTELAALNSRLQAASAKCLGLTAVVSSAASLRHTCKAGGITLTWLVLCSCCRKPCRSCCPTY